MKIITANTNGIRSAAKKGFFNWLEKQNADITCIQETKAQVHQLEDSIFHPGFSYYNDAVKKGYSGTALYCKREPDDVISVTGYDIFDTEGRYLEAKFDKLSVVSLYLPSGSAKDERQQIKYECMDFFMEKMEQMKSSGRDYIICGDWNIAHKNEDIRNWKGNKKNSGFLPEERAWLDTLFNDVGFIDGFREIDQEEHSYTWWSNRGQAYVNNTGWRIDYQVLSPSLKGMVNKTEIYKEEKFSDHAPLIIDYNYQI